jgi:hypothetical protein
MPIIGLLQNHAFEPEEIGLLVAVFEDTLREMRLANRSDPITEMVAKKVIELAQTGERDPVRLRERTIAALSGEG